MTTDHRPRGAEVRAGQRLAAAMARSQSLATSLLATAAGAIVLTMASRPGGYAAPRHLLIPLVACVLTVVLRRWPLPVLGVATVTAALFAATGPSFLPFGFLVGVALYFTAVGRPRRESIAIALAVAAPLGAAVAYAALMVRGAVPAVIATENFVPLAGAWFIADSVTARRRYLAGLAAQAERERAAEVSQERVRIAREMHDVVAHALAVITVQAGVGRCLADKRPEEATAALGSIETISRTAQDELRVVLGLLRDGEPGTAPLAPTPRLVDVKDLADTVRASGIAVELRTEGIDRGLSPSLELSIYRVAQEALTNIVKHAPGARAVAELTVSAGKVRLDVRDDGGPGGGQPPRATVGQASPAGEGTGQGITGMRERIGAFGGWLVAGPVAGGGFQVTAEVPIESGAG